MRKSNWIIFAGIGVKIPKMFELPPPSCNISFLETFDGFLGYLLPILGPFTRDY